MDDNKGEFINKLINSFQKLDEDFIQSNHFARLSGDKNYLEEGFYVLIQKYRAGELSVPESLSAYYQILLTIDFDQKESSFDPFHDFSINGYLQNTMKEKNSEIVKSMECFSFAMKQKEAISYLKKQKNLRYIDYLKIHEILFCDFYPWAGKDRKEVARSLIISKGNIYFASPNEIETIIEHGFSLSTNDFKKKSGEILGLFAWGHPFLDCNGRTMLLIYTELAYRAGFTINWGECVTDEFLNVLTQEIQSPRDSAMSNYIQKYLKPFKK